MEIWYWHLFVYRLISRNAKIYINTNIKLKNYNYILILKKNNIWNYKIKKFIKYNLFNIIYEYQTLNYYCVILFPNIIIALYPITNPKNNILMNFSTSNFGFSKIKSNKKIPTATIYWLI